MRQASFPNRDCQFFDCRARSQREVLAVADDRYRSIGRAEIFLYEEVEMCRFEVERFAPINLENLFIKMLTSKWPRYCLFDFEKWHVRLSYKNIIQ